MSTTLKGLRDVFRNLDRASEEFKRAAEEQLFAEGKIVQGQSQLLCPVDRGLLRASAYTSPPVRDGSQVSVLISYGMDYAVYVHERLDARHPTGEAKFLEKALQAHAPGFSRYMAAGIRRRMK